MQKFRTALPNISFPFDISYRDKITSIGSCFSDHIGSKLKTLKFDCAVNSMGILFNPISIQHSIHKAINNTKISEADLFLSKGRYCNWNFHGAFSSSSVEDTLQLMNTSISLCHDYLKKSDYLFITLGSSFAFEHLQEEYIVANCHKVDNKLFKRVSISIDVMTDAMQSVISSLKVFNPKLKIIFTVSPVRHLRDGLINSQLSKSKLVVLSHMLTEENKDVFYFPSYELIVDDLRDYRFYAEDMAHINMLGIDYIFNYFKQSFFNQSTSLLSRDIDGLLRSVEHKSLHPDTAEDINFRKETLQRIKKFVEEYPHIDFDPEIAKLKKLV